MSDWTIFSITLAGGFAVIMGYYFIIQEGLIAEMKKYFRKNELIFFYTLSSCSIISYFYLLYYSVFRDPYDEEGWIRPIYIASLVIYLLGACLWSISIYQVFRRGLNPKYQIPALLITAVGTLGVLTAVIASSSESGYYGVAVAAASILFFQHFFFDLFYWTGIHLRHWKKIKGKSKKTRNEKFKFTNPYDK